MSPHQASYQAPALEKGLDILELLADEPDGLSQKSVADRLNRSVGEIFRMLVALERRGYVRKRADDAYELTLRLFDLSHRYPPSRRLLLAAVEPMQEFSAKTHQSLHLAVQYSGNIMIIAHSDSPSILGLTVRLGSQLPVAETASGRVLLAYLHDGALDRWFEDHPQAAPNARSRQQLRSRLGPIRERGYEFNSSDRITGVVDISAPIFDITQSAVAALTVPFLTQTDSPMSQEDALNELCHTCASISAALGWMGDPVKGMSS